MSESVDATGQLNWALGWKCTMSYLTKQGNPRIFSMGILEPNPFHGDNVYSPKIERG